MRNNGDVCSFLIAKQDVAGSIPTEYKHFVCMSMSVMSLSISMYNMYVFKKIFK
jgi:hypothetical protein